MSFGDHLVGSIAGPLVDVATGTISASLPSVTFQGLIGDVTGSLSGSLSSVLSGIGGGALGDLSGFLDSASQSVQALFFRGAVVAIDSLSPDCTISEELTDSVTVTEHPVEFGAAITDHAFVNPCEVSMHLGWTSSKGGGGGVLASFLGADAPTPQSAYETLRGLMTQRDPVDVLSTKRVYSNMLITGMAVRTDDKTTNILDITVRMKQIILVGTSTTELKAETQANPDQTSSIQNVGTKLVSQVKDSALSTIAGIFD